MFCNRNMPADRAAGNTVGLATRHPLRYIEDCGATRHTRSENRK